MDVGNVKINNNIEHNNTMDSLEENLLEQWFLVRNISSGTQVIYKHAMKLYTDLNNRNIDELIQEAEEDQESGIQPRLRRVTQCLLKFKKYLEKSDLAPSTTNLYFYAIKSFYKSFDIMMIEIKLPRGDICLEKNKGKLLTKKDIHKLISVARPREKALIYLMALSGMAQQEARDLTLRQMIKFASMAIDKDLDDVYDLFKFEDEIIKEIVTLEITRKKVKIRHHTFIPPEAFREIIVYLKERCYGRNEKIKIESIDDFVFVNIYGKKLGRDSIVTNFRNLGTKAGLKREKGAYSYWRSHAMRKYFISAFINKLGAKILGDYMAGHKIDDLDRAYWGANPEDLKNYYIQVFPRLSLDDAKVRDFESKEFTEYIEKSKEKDEIVSSLIQEIAEMKKLNQEKENKNQARDKFLDKIMNNPKVMEELEELGKLDK